METLAHIRGEPAAIDTDAARALEPVRHTALFMIDRNGRIASWNEGVRRILGWEREDWIGQPLQVAFTPEDVQSGVPQMELGRAAATGCSDDTRWMQRKDGSRFFAQGALTLLQDAQGQTVGYLKALRDNSQQQQLDAEMSRSLLQLGRSQAEIERQAVALAAVMEAVSDGVVLSDGQGVQRCNAAALALLGADSLDELQMDGHRWYRRIGLRVERDGLPLAAEDTPMQAALAGHNHVQDLWARHAGSGADVVLRCVAMPIIVDHRVEGSVAVFSDLADRLQLRQERHDMSRLQNLLQASDAELRALLHGVRDYAIYTLDVAGRISSWHPGAQAMMGYSAEEAIGTHFERFFTEEDLSSGRPTEEMALAARNGEYEGEGLRLRKDRSSFDAAMVLTALRGPRGEHLGFLKLTQDISGRINQQREREAMLADTQAARAEAERASQAKGDFLATVSHELRTPLSAILSWAHLLQRGGIDAGTLDQGLAAIARNARVQGRLIEDLLDMSRIEAGQIRLDLQCVELGGVIAAAIDSALPAASDKGVGLRTVFSPGSGTVLGDAARLQQVLANLLNNAIKFTPQGGQVSVSLTQTESGLQIAVADTGQGIEPDFLVRMFHRFQQQDGSRTRRHGGLGLGLAIVRHLVQLHGGTVQARSPGSGQGSTFIVTLPLLAANAGLAFAVAQAGATTVQAVHAAPPRLDGLRVLLVDDEADMRAVTGQLLRNAGAELCLASNAEEGWAALQSFAADLIVSDIGMPGIDGYEFMRQLRTRPAAQGGQTPALAFTAYNRPEDHDRALSSGYQRHLGKAGTPALLLQALADLALSPRAAPAPPQ